MTKKKEKKDKDKDDFKRFKKVGFCILVAAMLVISGWTFLLSTRNTTEEVAVPSVSQNDDCLLAEELTENGWTLWGALGCPYCTQQKEMFGNCLDRIEYVDCALLHAQDMDGYNQSVCPDLIGFPAWVRETGDIQNGSEVILVSYGLHNESMLWMLVEVEINDKNVKTVGIEG